VRDRSLVTRALCTRHTSLCVPLNSGKACDGNFLDPSHMDVGRNHSVSMPFPLRCGDGPSEESVS